MPCLLIRLYSLISVIFLFVYFFCLRNLLLIVKIYRIKMGITVLLCFNNKLGKNTQGSMLSFDKMIYKNIYTKQFYIEIVLMNIILFCQCRLQNTKLKDKNIHEKFQNMVFVYKILKSCFCFIFVILQNNFPPEIPGHVRRQLFSGG